MQEVFQEDVSLFKYHESGHLLLQPGGPLQFQLYISVGRMTAVFYKHHRAAFLQFPQHIRIFQQIPAGYDLTVRKL